MLSNSEIFYTEESENEGNKPHIVLLIGFYCVVIAFYILSNFICSGENKHNKVEIQDDELESKKQRVLANKQLKEKRASN